MPTKIADAELGKGSIIQGVTDGSDAAAGAIGEYITAFGGSVQTPDSTLVNICSIELTAGDWDVNAMFTYNGAVSITVGKIGISVTSATLANYGVDYNFYTGNASLGVGGGTFYKRINVTTTTTVYMVASQQGAASSAGGNGTLSARRVR